MQPDRDLLSAALGRAASVEPLDTGGYTRSRAWRVTTPNGPTFVKEAADEGSLSMLRREAAVYQGVEGSFLPAFIGFADSDDRALLAIEYLEGAHWPPPYPDDAAALFDALSLVAATAPPADLPTQGPRHSRWEKVSGEQEPFLGLGLCSPEWLHRSLETLIAAEKAADFRGEALVHNDVYSGNIAFTRRGAVLVDWGAAVRGSPWIDVAFALLSVRAEGSVPPKLDFPDESAFAAALAGMLAVEAPAPLPDWSEPGSTLRQDMASDLGHALRWVAELLDLPHPR